MESTQLSQSRHSSLIPELQQIFLFKDVDLSSVEAHLNHCQIKTLEPEEILISPTHNLTELFFLLSGQLRVHLQTDMDPVAFIEPGGSVGELSVIDGKPPSAYVIAHAPCRLLSINSKTFWDFVRSSPTIVNNILLTFAQRLRGNNSILKNSIDLSQEYKMYAMIDGLTGIYNRRWLNDIIPKLMKKCRDEKEPLSLLMIDVDFFKKFNDQYGHAAGDQVLIGVAKTVAAHVRPSDLAARYGGEEFTVILPKTDVAGAFATAERLRIAVSELKMMLSDDKPLPSVTISLGVAKMEADDTMETLMSRADEGLYRAKQSGRNRACQ